MIELDGSFGEGGGQIVRTALALSTVTGKAFRVKNIRKGRCSSGLKNQHLYCIKALCELSGALAEGAELGSEELTFYPKPIKGRTLSIDVGTAGSITLLLQSLLLPAIISGKTFRFKIIGGTDVKWSMPIDYFINVLLPQLKKYAEFKVAVEKRGYYPKGDGKVDIRIKPKFSSETISSAPKFNLPEQGNLLQIKGVSHSSSDLESSQVSSRQAKAAKYFLANLGCPVNISEEYCKTMSTGSGITLWALFARDKSLDDVNPSIIGADSLGEQRKKAETVGQEAAQRLLNEINYKAPVDEYLADNIIPFLAFFGGTVKVSKITSHVITNIYAVESFLGKIFDIDTENRTIAVERPIRNI